jgi:predicted PurR-regulated permease PerM
VATGTVYALLGLPGALLLGLIAAITEAIPDRRTAPLRGIPAILVAATVSPQLAVVVTVVYVCSSPRRPASWSRWSCQHHRASRRSSCCLSL